MMIRIGVVSDSHGNTDGLKRAVEQMGEVQAIFHLGDLTKDGERIRKWRPDIPVHTIRGNMDRGYPTGEDFIKTSYGGKTIIACHGQAFGVKDDLKTYFLKAKSQKADIALFGHTHRALIETRDDILFMNPGALWRASGGKTFGIITIDGENVQAEIVPLAKGEGCLFRTQFVKTDDN